MPESTWQEIRRRFVLSRRFSDFSYMALGPVPVSTASAIEAASRALDDGALEYADAHNPHKSKLVFEAVSEYFEIAESLIAHTHSTTMGLAQLYGGIVMRPGQEILTSQNEHFTTLEALRLRRLRDGTPFRQIPLFADSRKISTAEILKNLERGIRPETRVLALTWVYSSDGVKLPMSEIAALVRHCNKTRSIAARILFVIDGVHGFGVEDVTFDRLGCDLFAAGCHKWIFGPRGTAILCGTEEAWHQVVSIVPSFSDPASGIARQFQPGGIQALENIWAMADAFRFIMSIGKKQIQERVHDLATQLKDGIRTMSHVDLRTPLSSDHSSGIVCFDVTGKTAADVVDCLMAKHRVKATESGIDSAVGHTHARLSPGILNTPHEVDAAIRAVGSMAPPAFPPSGPVP